MTTLLAFIVVLGVLVFVHELGHFAAAKWAGIYVHRFAIGMGKPIPGLSVRRGETEYALCWLPLGGYVKMATQEEGAEGELEGGGTDVVVPPDRWFEAKPVWKRVIVISAGVTMNLLFAWAVYVGLALVKGRQVDPTTTVGRVVVADLPKGAEGLAQLQPGDRITAVDGRPVDAWDEILDGIVDADGNYVALTLSDGRTVRVEVHVDAIGDRVRAAQALLPSRPPIVELVSPGRAAERAGLMPGDTVLALAGEPVREWYAFVERVERSAGQPLALTIGSRTGRRDVTVTPAEERVTRGDSVRTVGRIGVQVATPVRSEPFPSTGAAVWAGTVATGRATGQIVRTVRGLIGGQVSRRELGGPVAIAQMAGQASRVGLDYFLAFMALISVNLAVLNLLPIPVLDGGHLLFLLAEAVIRRPLSVELRNRLTLVGLAAVGTLMLVALSNDIMRLLGR
ncbi:MAG: RIP metalloprotease RseP [Gemmatimonadales bacterium]|nr:RIP metalloprotease RseP [Gemmatimonadales bacterium]